jgi:hypothetical protein
MTCRKAPGYRTRDDAVAAAHKVLRATFDFGKWRAYQCRKCRFPGGQRAWHWGHLCRGRAK